MQFTALIKLILANFVTGMAKDKLTSAGGVVAGAVAATLPAMAGGQPMTVSDDPAMQAAQAIATLISVALFYWDRNREKQK